MKILSLEGLLSLTSAGICTVYLVANSHQVHTLTGNLYDKGAQKITELKREIVEFRHDMHAHTIPRANPETICVYETDKQYEDCMKRNSDPLLEL